MAQNKSMQYGVLFVIFVVVMVVIGVLNQRISEEISEKTTPVAAPVIAPVPVEDAIPVETAVEPVMPQEPGTFTPESAKPVVIQPKEQKAEDSEPVYELPLREDNLPL